MFGLPYILLTILKFERKAPSVKLLMFNKNMDQQALIQKQNIALKSKVVLSPCRLLFPVAQLTPVTFCAALVRYKSTKSSNL